LFGVFFFFQAEDGIRDKLVTGVQTCALPISGIRHFQRLTGSGEHHERASATAKRALRRLGAAYGSDAIDSDRVSRACSSRGSSRSEERRVGKECRSRWPAAQQKKQIQQTQVK